MTADECRASLLASAQRLVRKLELKCPVELIDEELGILWRRTEALKDALEAPAKVLTLHTPQPEDVVDGHPTVYPESDGA